jgi:capsule polysaccharide export protein KpsE/RkpR
MVDFVRRATTARIAAVVGGMPPRYAVKIGGLFSSLNIWFWAIVGLPTLIAGVYFFGIASDLYMSEVKFVVRGPAKSTVR